MAKKAAQPSSERKVKVVNAQTQVPVVGIGASAGGLEALEDFFSNVPDECGMAFVVIQHMNPSQAGFLPELLQRITTLKVFQVKNRIKIEPNCIYVIPPNNNLAIKGDRLILSELVELHGLRLPVDFFFRSLADERQEKSIGIVLSGMGSDGSLGVKAIREKNGMVIIQEPDSAKFNTMPLSASVAVVADIIAPPGEIPQKLLSFLKYLPDYLPDQLQVIKDKSNIDKIIALLYEITGHNFSQYKKTTLFRRIERRKNVYQIEKIQQYLEFLHENPKEVEILFKELLIGVTSFFRDPAVWNYLRDEVFPSMIKNLPDRHIIRAWVPGCSTGEEAYSLAMVFVEALENEKNHEHLRLQIFATDIDTDAIDKARTGFFSENITSDVSPGRISRFFSHESGGYKIAASIREMLVFAPHNVIKDPPFTKLNIISCRNLMIYMEHELQKNLISLFHYALRPSGILLLGSAESPGPDHQGFVDLVNKHKVFKRSSTPTDKNMVDFPSSFHREKTIPSKKEMIPKTVDNIQSIAETLLLQHYAPASVLVNDRGDILFVTGHTGKYLEPVAGKADWNIYSMAREGLRQVLPGAFTKALKNYELVVVRNIRIRSENAIHFTDLKIQQIEYPVGIRGYIILVFSDTPATETNPPTGEKTRKDRPSGVYRKELEMELERAYEELKKTRDEMQTSEEEMKTINEELQSTNEELQSSNEELTTAKEEMQSMNEELQTINTELQSKIKEYVRTSDDMVNLLNSTEIATLFLDRELNIRRFTNYLTRIFKLRDSDIGRPFTDLVTTLKYPEMDHHARQVIQTLNSIETSIETRDGLWFSVRIMPYRTLDDRIDGLVITFTDTTKAKKMEHDLLAANQVIKRKRPGPG